jgi:hypothetical protein
VGKERREEGVDILGGLLGGRVSCIVLVAVRIYVCLLLYLRTCICALSAVVIPSEEYRE